MGKDCEIFVPRRVALRHFRGIYVYDKDSARSHGSRSSTERRPRRPRRVPQAGYPSQSRLPDIFNFPTDYAPTCGCERAGAESIRRRGTQRAARGGKAI